MAPLDSVLTLLSPDGECEVLGELSVAEVRDDLFAKGPMHEVMVRPAFTAGKMQMTWGSAQWESTPVNDAASMLAGQQVRGTVLLAGTLQAQEALLKSLNSRFRTHSTEWRPQQRGMTSHHHHPAKLSRPVSGAERGRHIRRRQSSAQDFMSRLLESRSGQLDDSTCDEIDEADLRGPSRDNSPHRHKPAHHSDLEAAPRGLQTPTPDLSPPYSASSLPTANCANPTASAPQRTCEPTPSACTFLQPSKVPEQEPPSFPPWQDLPPGLLCHIVLFLGDTAATLMPPCGTCKSWRDALAHNQWLLKRTWFNLSLDAPCKPAAGHPPAGAAATASCSSARAAAAAGASAQATAQLQRASSERPPLQRQRYMLGLSGAAGALRTSADAAQPAEQRSAEDSSGVMAASDAKALLQGVPVLLTEAARLRNATATGVLAQLHEVAGNVLEANRWWQRGAKAGDVESMFKAGFAMYERCEGIEPDADGAFMMLSKALKKVFNVSSLSQIQVDSKAAPEAPAGQQEEAGATAASAPASMTRLVERMQLSSVPPGQAAALMQLVARAAVILGYLHFDGEGVRADQGEACRLFKLAAACGSKEGSRVLGWMWNTGQF